MCWRVDCRILERVGFDIDIESVDEVLEKAKVCFRFFFCFRT